MMNHSSKDFWVTLVALIGGTVVSVQNPELREFVHPIIAAFVGSWLRVLPSPNGNGDK
jgi:hypothetical protein